jgi:xanthine/uracil permease
MVSKKVVVVLVILAIVLSLVSISINIVLNDAENSKSGKVELKSSESATVGLVVETNTRGLNGRG